MNIAKKQLEDKLRLYAVTDSGLTKDRGIRACVEKAINGGITMLQYREKILKGEELKAEAVSIRNICREKNVPFIINDNVELAKEIEADGVHLGANDMPVKEARKLLGDKFIIGATAKTPEQARSAEEEGADYLGSGAIFGTTTKSDAKPMDMDTLKNIVKSVNIPVVAIGGINSENIVKLEGTGISGVAVVNGIFGNTDIEEETKKLLLLIEKILITGGLVHD